MSRGEYGAQRAARSHALVGKQRLAQPGEDNYGWFDRYTAGHAAFGIIGGLGRLPWWGMLASGLVWDLVIERQFKDRWPKLWPNSTQDTWRNIAGDTVVMMAGWKLAKMLPEGKTPTNTTIVEPAP